MEGGKPLGNANRCMLIGTRFGALTGVSALAALFLGVLLAG